MFNTIKRFAIANPTIGTGIGIKKLGSGIETVGQVIKFAGFTVEVKGRLMKLSTLGVGVEGAAANPEVAVTAIANHYSCGSYVKLVPLLDADWAKQNCKALQEEFNKRTLAAGGTIPTEESQPAQQQQQQPAPQQQQPQPAQQSQPQQQQQNPFASYSDADAEAINLMAETC